jgi:hypothetical protein
MMVILKKVKLREEKTLFRKRETLKREVENRNLKREDNQVIHID